MWSIAAHASTRRETDRSKHLPHMEGSGILVAKSGHWSLLIKAQTTGQTAAPKKAEMQHNGKGCIIALAKKLAELQLAAAAVEETGFARQGLGSAKAHQEEEKRKMDSQKKSEQLAAKQQLKAKTMVATAAATKETNGLHNALQEITSTSLGRQMQDTLMIPESWIV
jgi:hypothetical protein